MAIDRGWEASLEEETAKPSRWTGEKRYQIVKEALSQKEPIGQIARRHQVSEALIYRWREKFFEGGKAALAFDGRNGGGNEKAPLERQIEELQKLIGEQAIEIRFLKPYTLAGGGNSRGQCRQQPDELLSGAQARGTDPA